MASPDPLVYEARVCRGARFMDERHPGWHTKISLDELDMSSGLSCVIGQSFNKADFYGTKVLDLCGEDHRNRRVYSWETRHGFNLPTGVRRKSHSSNRECWDLLRKLWDAQIQDRLIADMG